MQYAIGTDNMNAGDDVAVVLTFSQMLASGESKARVEVFAAERGWLDGEGRPTEAGRQLARALQQQRGTRTVFRLW
jgi:hypothetical protein